MCIFVYAQHSAHVVLCTCDYTCVVDLFNWYIMQIVMVRIARLHSQRHTFANAQVIKSKNEQNCSLIHMMKYNPLDGNCICFVLTFVYTHACAHSCCLHRTFHVCLFRSPSPSPTECVHKYVLNLLSGWQRRLRNHQSAAALDVWVLRFNIGSSSTSNNNNFFNQII